MSAVAESIRSRSRGRPPSARIRDVVTPAPREAWQAAYEADPEALVTQSPEWLDCICAVGAYEDASRLYDFGGGRHAGSEERTARWSPQNLLRDEVVHLAVADSSDVQLAVLVFTKAADVYARFQQLV